MTAYPPFPPQEDPKEPIETTPWYLRPPNMRRRLKAVAIGWVLIGALGTCIAGLSLPPDLRAAQGGGVTGRFTLTELNGCDDHPPPQQRCDWSGNFISDDGKTVAENMELAGELPSGATVGDTLAARDTGSRTQIYQLNDTRAWRMTAAFLAAFASAFLVGLAALQPWTWRDRFRLGPLGDRPQA